MLSYIFGENKESLEEFAHNTMPSMMSLQACRFGCRPGCQFQGVDTPIHATRSQPVTVLKLLQNREMVTMLIVTCDHHKNP